MTQAASGSKVTTEAASIPVWSGPSPYEQWIQSIGLPIHRGYYIPDVRSLELGWWEARQCLAAFLVLAGQEGVTEARVTEIPAGKVLPPLRFALDEIIYVVEGRGLTTIWAEGRPKKTFEWHKHSMFLVPRTYFYQLANAQGDKPVRLLHYNYLPIAMSIVPDPEFYFNNPYINVDLVYGQQQREVYAAPKSAPTWDEWAGHYNLWYGYFFPDMRAWDKVDAYRRRGAGGHRVRIQFPNSGMWCHMSVFPARTYKKAHRHGPGIVIIIPAGEGYSILWPEDQEKIVIPWHEASVFVPPNRWFHQHFNVGSLPARYLAFHAPRSLGGFSEKVEDRKRDQIEYPDEDPWIRQKFEEELAKRGLTSLMPEEAYTDPDYQWHYEDGP